MITHKTFSIILLIQKSSIFFTIQNNYVKINIEEHIIVWVILLISRSFKVSNRDLIKKKKKKKRVYEKQTKNPKSTPKRKKKKNGRRKANG